MGEATSEDDEKCADEGKGGEEPPRS